MTAVAEKIAEVLRDNGLDASGDVHSWRCFEWHNDGIVLIGNCTCLTDLAELIAQALGVTETVEWNTTATKNSLSFNSESHARHYAKRANDGYGYPLVSRTVVTIPPIVGEWQAVSE